MTGLSITGNELFEMGFNRDKVMGLALLVIREHYAHNSLESIQGIMSPLLDNPEEFIEDFILGEIAILLSPVGDIKPHSEPVFFHRNIRASGEYELLNLKGVTDTMDLLMRTPTVVGGAIMPDACPTGEAGQIPVGGVVVTRNSIHPSMHSADICCSVMMTSFSGAEPLSVLNAAHELTHFGPGGRGDNDFELPIELEIKILGNKFLKDLLPIAKSHLGTCGDGNHFIFVGNLESSGDASIVTHFGSRGFGAKLYKKGMLLAERYRKKISPDTIKRNAWIPYDTEDGVEYWEALQIVRSWTKLNHEMLHDKVMDRLGKSKKLRFWNEHNFVFKDGDLFYHAKGATPLDDKYVPDSHGGLRLIPLNMSEPILIARGETTHNNLGFAPHGAGRNMSRTQHQKNKEGKTYLEILDEETIGIDARFFSGKIDISELPSAYKSADEIQSQMVEFGLGDVVDRILPFGCIMAGAQDKPWKK